MASREKVHVVVDDTTIAAEDPWAVIHPVWWSANIYDGPAAYELSFNGFSQAQRLLFAVRWYISEVENGGHTQFYSNSTGIVWKDALEGFQAMGIPEAANILSISAGRLGGAPPLEREDRQHLLAALQPDFDDCDEAFYKLAVKVDFDEKLMEFIRSRPHDFYFSGTIERVVLPKRIPPAN